MKIDVRYGGDFDGDIVKWMRGRVADGEKILDEELEAAMKLGEETMIYHIATRGTAKSGKAGRIETEKMIRSVTSRVDKMRNGRARGFFGWLDAWNNTENDYFRYQEGGFTHNITGDFIEGMNAMADAAEVAFEELRRRVAERLKRGS